LPSFKKGIFIIVAFSFIEGVASPNVAFGEADAFGNAKASGQTKTRSTIDYKMCPCSENVLPAKEKFFHDGLLASPQSSNDTSKTPLRKPEFWDYYLYKYKSAFSF
jgi:hypothetical protein